MVATDGACRLRGGAVRQGAGPAAQTRADAGRRHCARRPPAPDLRLADGQRAALTAEAERDALRPPLRVGAELENVFGTGPTRALDQAELTVTLAGVLERGGKLDARRTLAQARLDALAPQRALARLDVLAEVARRYLAIGMAAQRTRRRWNC